MCGSIPWVTRLAEILGKSLGTQAGVLAGGIGMALSALPVLTRSMGERAYEPTSQVDAELPSSVWRGCRGLPLEETS